jgi:hypothetical protein
LINFKPVGLHEKEAIEVGNLDKSQELLGKPRNIASIWPVAGPVRSIVTSGHQCGKQNNMGDSLALD